MATPPASRWTLALLWSSWAACFFIAVACAAIFVQGIWRDHRVGEPDLRVDFGVAGDWIEVPFRVWGEGRYKLFMSSVNHDPARVGAPLNAEFEIAVDAPDRRFFQRSYGAGATGHSVPSNYGDVRLGTFEVDGSPLRTWTLRARVVKADPAFRGVASEIKFWKERYDPGMGGLINYVMIIPAGFFMLVALVPAGLLARRRFVAPIWITSATAIGMLAFIGT